MKPDNSLGKDIGTYPPLSQRERHAADFFAKQHAYIFLETWAKLEKRDSIRFRGVKIADFDLEHLRLLCEWLGANEIKRRDEQIDKFSPEKVFAKQ